MSRGKKKTNKNRRRPNSQSHGGSDIRSAESSSLKMETIKKERDMDVADSDSSHGLNESGKMEPPSVIVSSNETDLSDESIFDDDDYNSGMYHGLRGRRYCLSTLRFFGLTVILWCSQYVVSSSMKHLGVLEGEDTGMRFEFDPSTMAQRVIPQLQENWNSMLNTTRNPLAATYYTRQAQRPGYQLAQQGAGVGFPVVMIPGKQNESTFHFLRRGVLNGIFGVLICPFTHSILILFASTGFVTSGLEVGSSLFESSSAL